MNNRGEGTDMRLLVLDGSRVLPALIRQLVPQDVDVDTTASFDEAIKELSNKAPDALIVNVTPAQLPWGRLQDLCHNHQPRPIPVLYESCVFDSPRAAGIDDLNGHSSFVTMPFHADELRGYIYRLLDLAGSDDLDIGDKKAQSQH